MITKAQYEKASDYALAQFEKAGIAITPQERDQVEVSDFGLGDFQNSGLTLLTYVNTERCCAKEMVLQPGQTCPEHRHPRFGDYIGKEETFRVRRGTVYLYVEGEPSPSILAKLPVGEYTVFHEIVLKAGEQYTLRPNLLHWFQGGSEGAVVSEFSTPSYDDQDVFTDARIHRAPEVQAI